MHVLSIGKLAAGQAKYYLDQAEGRVDVVESVGNGLEEYYVGGHEARGDWHGAAARRLGLTGPVESESLRRVLAGEGPDGRPLRESASAVRVAGFDLTFSAPKSVSVLFALAGRPTRDAVRRSHDRAVREALGHVERSAAAVRRGHGGAQVEPASGLVAAAFRHRTSRAGDPQLHTHVLVANLGQGPDARWSALDGRRLYAQARTASFLYQAVLRSELTRQLGVEWLTVRDGIADVAGVPKPVMRAFSRRRADIEAALAEQGTSGPRASEAAALATRRAKDRRTDIATLTEDWLETAAELGFEPGQLARALGHRRPTRRLGEADRERLFDALSAPSGLTRRQATFSRRDVIQVLCERLPSDLALDADRLEGLADRFLGSSRVVALLPAQEGREGRLAFRRRDGRLLPVAREDHLYSTPELLALERHVVESAAGSGDAGAGRTTPSAADRAIAVRPSLSEGQRAMVEHLCLGGERIAVVAGRAGTGKTYALAAAREAWHASGHPVLGVAVARRAAKQLQADAGIATTSVTALLADLEREGGGLPHDVVLVVDEAGMVGTRPLAALLAAVERADGKLVLVGDHRQLPELEAGGAFRGLVQRGLAVELTENRRQRQPWERRALDQLRDGRVEAAVRQYVDHARIHIAGTAGEARQQLARDAQNAPTHEDVVMIAQRRDEVADLNRRARTLRREVRDLAEPELALPGGGFAAGDLVLIKRNDPRLGVTNGDRGRVLAVDPTRKRLRVDLAGVVVTLDEAFLTTPTVHGDPSLLHGYAVTCHVAQGLTVDRALVLGGDGLSSELAYTALSRGRNANHLYLARESDDPRAEYAPGRQSAMPPLDRLVAGLKTSRATVLAIDAGIPHPERRLAHAEGELARARAKHAALEQRRWRPGRRAELAVARGQEAVAEETVAQLTRAAAEGQHARRPFVDDREVAQRLAADRDRRLERHRTRDRGHGIER